MYDLLRALPLFETCPDDALHALAPMLRQQSFVPGDLLTRQGDDATVCYLILMGTCEVFVSTEQQRAVHAIRSEGKLVGESALIRDMPYETSARAKTMLEAAVFNEPAIMFWLYHDPKIMLRMIRESYDRYNRLAAIQGLLESGETFLDTQTLFDDASFETLFEQSPNLVLDFLRETLDYERDIHSMLKRIKEQLSQEQGESEDDLPIE